MGYDLIENLDRIEEINGHIKDALKQWSDICVHADADNWSHLLNYDEEAVHNVVLLFMHVCTNVGIKKKRVSEKAAEVYGGRIRDLVQSMTGYDTWEFAEKLAKQKSAGHEG